MQPRLQPRRKPLRAVGAPAQEGRASSLCGLEIWDAAGNAQLGRKDRSPCPSGSAAGHRCLTCIHCQEPALLKSPTTLSPPPHFSLPFSFAPPCRAAIDPSVPRSAWSEFAGDGVVLKALRPIGGTEFIVAPRQLPPVKELEVRVDSSLRGGPEVTRPHRIFRYE